MRSAILLATLQLSIGGCDAQHSGEPDADREPAERESANRDASDDLTAAGCEAAPGSPIDLRSEPATWRKFVAAEWTDANGCLVRIDVLAEYQGIGHCGWQDARNIVTGDPIGARRSSPEDSHKYVRDPTGVYGNRALAEAFEPHATLPDTARDTGFRRGEVELWIDPEDATAIYLKEPTNTERWPAGDVPLCM